MGTIKITKDTIKVMAKNIIRTIRDTTSKDIIRNITKITKDIIKTAIIIIIIRIIIITKTSKCKYIKLEIENEWKKISTSRNRWCCIY